MRIVLQLVLLLALSPLALAKKLPDYSGTLTTDQLTETGRYLLGRNSINATATAEVEVGQLVYEGYVSSARCLEYGDSGIRHPELDPCLREEIVWTPRVTLTIPKSVLSYTLNGVRKDVALTQKGYISNDCIANLNELEVVGEMPRTAPTEILFTEECSSYIELKAEITAPVRALNNAMVTSKVMLASIIHMDLSGNVRMINGKLNQKLSENAYTFDDRYMHPSVFFYGDIQKDGNTYPLFMMHAYMSLRK